MQDSAESSCGDIGGWLGRSAEREFVITNGLISDFCQLSGDKSPIHVDDECARRRGFSARVMHGALQAALVSCVIGMDLPGHRGVLQELSLQFRKPAYAGDRLTVRVTVKEVHESVRVAALSLRITNQNGEVVATGKAQSGLVQD